jgi:DNA-binding LacI/PurR family transcriptional regulator
MKSLKTSGGKLPVAVTLKVIADRVGLTPGTVSGILNNSPKCKSVPQSTKERTLAAVRELNYRPNYHARALRVNRTYTIGLLAAEIGYSYGPVLIDSIEKYLRDQGFFYFTAAHHHDEIQLETYTRLLGQQGVEGFITLDTCVTQTPLLPTVAVASHRAVPSVTNVVLDQRKAARLALMHLHELQHTEIAFMKGPASSADAEDRWNCICECCRELGIRIRPELTVQLEGDAACAPELNHRFVKELLSRKRPFTALFAFNDNSAIAAMRVMNEAGLSVPGNVSVVGFDDIKAAACTTPGLTTIRQPLQKMGEIAARTLLAEIEDPSAYVPVIEIEPELVVRGSTAAAA